MTRRYPADRGADTPRHSITVDEVDDGNAEPPDDRKTPAFPTIEELAKVTGRDEDELRKAAAAITRATQPDGDRDSENAPQPQSGSDEGGTAVEPRPRPGYGGGT